MKYLRSLFSTAAIDGALLGAFGGLKAIVKFLAGKFVEAGGEKLTETSIDDIVDWFSVDDRDECIIDDAIILLTDGELDGWNEKVASFLPDPATATAEETEKGEMMKDYYRRMVAKAKKPALVAERMKRDGGMALPAWDGYKDSLSIKYKAVAKHQKFLDWIESNGKDFLVGMKDNRKKVDDQIGEMAKDADDWLAKFKTAKGIK